MLSGKSLVMLVGVGAVAANAFIGCNGDLNAFDLTEFDDAGSANGSLLDGGQHQNTDSGSIPKSDGGDAGNDADAGKDEETYADAGGDADAGKETDADADVPDAGPVELDPEGSPCSPADDVQGRPCGNCGTQYRLCAADPDNPGGPTVWQSWGYCQGEPTDACRPGDRAEQSCGRCGTRPVACQDDCTWFQGLCREPENACDPGTVEFKLGISCDAGGRKRVCQDTCTFGPYGACVVPGLEMLTVSGTVGEKVRAQYTFDQGTVLPRLVQYGSCADGTVSIMTTSTPYSWVMLKNPTASTLRVSVWTGMSTLPGSFDIDTIMASYARDSVPLTDSERQTCSTGVADSCSWGDDPDTTACTGEWAALIPANDGQVTVPPNGTAVIYVASYYYYISGNYQLTVRTDDAY